MLTAQNRHAIRAKTTASGSEPPAKATPAGIDAAMAAPGAMSVMLWNVTSRRPMAFRRRPVVVSLAVSVVIDVPPRGRSRSMPGWSHGRHGSHQGPPSRSFGSVRDEVFWVCPATKAACLATVLVTVRAERGRVQPLVGKRDLGRDVGGEPDPVAVAQARLGAGQHPVPVDERAVGRLLVADGRLAAIGDGDRGVPPGHVLVL